MRATTAKVHLSCTEYALITFCFLTCLTGALLLPVNQCPDEQARILISSWIFERKALPTGDEFETMIPGWGGSYALRPYLSSIVGAVFERIAVCFTDSSRILLAASRMCSILSETFCCFFCLRLGHRLFEKQGAAALFAVLVCFLPQVTFLGMYQNNDSLSLCAVSMMLSYLIEGFDLGWPVRSCIGLGISISLGLLAYYSVYGWLLMGVLYYAAAVLSGYGRPGNKRFFSSDRY